MQKARKKQRAFQHIMEDSSYDIIKKYIPKEWVVREFNKPDYGIDIVIELFDKIGEEYSETLGEFLFVQVKSIKEAIPKKEKVYPVSNVSKNQWIKSSDDFVEIDVLKFIIDTNSIYSIQTLGSSISVLFFLVDITNEKVYFICLNDYIDKCLRPKNPNYIEQNNVTISIPVMNDLSNTEVAIAALKNYGKRAKLLAAFSLFAYQKNEIAQILDIKDFPVVTYRDEISENKKITHFQFYKQIIFFIEQIEFLEIWKQSNWGVLCLTKKELDELKTYLKRDKVDWEEARSKTIICWHHLTNLNSIYEEICREWFLPKTIGILTSYP